MATIIPNQTILSLNKSIEVLKCAQTLQEEMGLRRAKVVEFTSFWKIVFERSLSSRRWRSR